MKLEEYQAEARKTQPNLDLDNMLTNAALGLSGEAGEVVDGIKKVLYQGHDFNPLSIADELGDVLWYVAMLSDAIGIPMDEIMKMNIDKLRDRYKKGKFSAEESRNRKEYQQGIQLISLVRHDTKGDFLATYVENGEKKETTITWQEVFEATSWGHSIVETNDNLFYKILANRK